MLQVAILLLQAVILIGVAIRFNTINTRLRILHKDMECISNTVKSKLERIMTTLAELPGALDAIDAKLSEGISEVTAEISSLKDLLSQQGTLSPEVEASLARLQAKADAIANISPALANTTVA